MYEIVAVVDVGWKHFYRTLHEVCHMFEKRLMGISHIDSNGWRVKKEKDILEVLKSAVASVLVS